MFQRITHPRLMSTVARYRFNAIAKLDIAVITQDPVSGENILSYIINPDYQAVQCQIEPYTGDEEIRRTDMTVVIEPYTVMLDRATPEVTPNSRLTVADGTIHNIISVLTDSLHSHTNLITEIIDNGV